MKIVITTSTLPVSDDDKVPAFVKDQAKAIKKNYPDTEIVIHAPHNAHSKTAQRDFSETSYREVRYHYFWPAGWELLTGRGILPALKENKLLYLQVPFFFLFQFISLWRLVRREKPDLIYAHWFTPQAVTSSWVSRLTKTPFIFTTHAADVAVWRKVPFGKLIVRSTCRRAAAFTAVSERTADKLKSFFTVEEWHQNYEGKLSIIPMGVDAKAPAINLSDKADAKRAFNIPENKKYLLFLGRLAEKKGVSYLLEAISLLQADASEKIHVIIAGDGQLKESLEKQSGKLNLKNVTFTGYVHGLQKDALLAMADYVCLPSIIDAKGDSEGLPVVFMEGLAAGKIVLASDASSGESFLENAKSGFVFKEKSAEEIADAINQALALTPNQITDMLSLTLELAKQFDWNVIAREHYQIFEKAIGK